MHPYHQQTAHTIESVRRGSEMDWSHQPQVYKQYPDEFPEIQLNHLPDLKNFLFLSSGLTARKVYPGGEYFLRVNPSAGALYPCELYIQARDVQGLEDGIYHFEPQCLSLRLLFPLNANEGLEAWCPDQRRVSGLVLLISTIYYRSSWKYRSRALRYCLLDTGHLLGAVEAAAWCTGRPFQALYRIDQQKIAAGFCFGNRELVMGMAVCGQRQEELARQPGMNLPFVDGAGNHQTDSLIEQTYADCCALTDCRIIHQQQAKPWPVATDQLTKAIVERRSIREFTCASSLTVADYETIIQAALEPIPSDCDGDIRLWSVVNHIDGLQKGIYEGMNCWRAGNFSHLAGHLCLEQPLGAKSGVTFFLTSKDDDNYLALMQKAGIIGQRIYLTANLLGAGCSGIGAFYDDEVADFLDTDGIILYALVVGH